MTYSTPSISTAQMSSMPSKLLSMALGSKPQMSIHLSEPRSIYTTLDNVSGKVTITPTHDTRFENISIQFIGLSKTNMERPYVSPGLPAHRLTTHVFLKLTQPISESAYPQPRILEAGRSYEFPFLFVVPQQLLPHICRHAAQHDCVRDLHLQLPPSLGSNGDEGSWEAKLDNFTPMMANISYNIVARIQNDDAKTVAYKTKGVKILPRFEEQPPISNDDGDHQLRKEKSISKGLFKGRLGSLVMEADQPKSLHLPPHYPRSQMPVSTTAKVRLRFDPSDGNASPPKLGSLSSKLKVNTWFSDAGRPIVPNNKCLQFDMHQGMYHETLSLSSRCVEKVGWTLHKGTPSVSSLNRCDSAVSQCSIGDAKSTAPSRRFKSGEFYTAEITVPITLPANKYFVPTFHSCLTSRTYTLYLHLSTQGGTVSSPSLELKVPVQISSEGGAIRGDQITKDLLTAEEEIEEALFADEFFAPRKISPMEESWMGNSTLSGVVSSTPADLPPEYELLGQVGPGIQAVA